MDCSKFQKHITAYLDGFLSVQDREAFAEHLSSCPVCRGDYDKFRELNEMIDQADLNFSVPSLTGEIMAEIKNSGIVYRENGSGSMLRNRSGARRLRSVLGDLVVAAAAAMVILWFSGPLLDIQNVSGGYSKEVFKISGTIGSVFNSYVRLSVTAVDKLSVSVKSIDQIQLKGDVEN